MAARKKPSFNSQMQEMDDGNVFCVKKDLNEGAGSAEDERMDKGINEFRNRIANVDRYLTAGLPFSLEYVYGHKPETIVICLSDNEIMYSVGNVIVLYTMAEDKSINILTHDKDIISLSSNKTCRFFLSMDEGTMHIWDREKFISGQMHPLRSIYNVFVEKNGSSEISPNGKYLATVNENVTEIQFWRWSFGSNDPCYSQTIHKSYDYGRLIKLTFDTRNSRIFTILCTNAIILANWLEDEVKFNIYIPNLSHIHDEFVDAVNLWKLGETIIATNKGNLVVLSDHTFSKERRTLITRSYIKKVKISDDPLTYLTQKDEVLIVADDAGKIQIFNTELHVLYWILTPYVHILRLSFNSFPRKYRLISIGDDLIEEEGGEEEDEDIETIYLETCPREASIEKNPLIIRDFMIISRQYRLVKYDFIRDKYTEILLPLDDRIQDLDVNKTKNYICVGTELGKIFLINYLTNKVVVEYDLIGKFRKTFGPVNSTIRRIKYSEIGNRFGVAIGNGYLQILDGDFLAAIIEKPFFITASPIVDICFSSFGKFLAYYDTSSTLVLLMEKYEWKYTAKRDVHKKDIVAVYFIPGEDYDLLYSFGKDRMFVEYDISAAIEHNELKVKRIGRLETQFEPTAVTVAPSNVAPNGRTTTGLVFLIINSGFKVKIFDCITMELIHTILGPLHDTPIHDIQYFEANDGNYFIYCSDKLIGIQLPPLDGNQFKHMAQVAHSWKIIRCIGSNKQNKIFTLDHCQFSIFQWSVKSEIVQQLSAAAGDGIQPFVQFLPGSHIGWLFKELQDYFYYFQILERGIDSQEETILTEKINIVHIPDFMRAMGFFVTESEINEMMKEVTRVKENEIIPSRITLEQFLKLYINYKPVRGHLLSDIVNTVHYFVNEKDDIGVENTRDGEPILDRDNLINILTSRGDPLSKQETVRYLYELHRDSENIVDSNDAYAEDGAMSIHTMLNDVPEYYNCNDFIEELLGIELSNRDPIVPAFGDITDPSLRRNILSNDSKTKMASKEFDNEEND